ncbi:putative sugar epimerase YhfK [Lactococcus garvieae]|nr:putative sugar epimerase YhfK [Lactococcus garvieae]
MDIVNNSIEEFAAAMSDVDAVVFSAGAGGSGLDKTIMIDLDGAVKIMTAAEKAKVKRFVMVSTFRVEEKKLHVKFKKILRLRFTRLQRIMRMNGSKHEQS